MKILGAVLDSIKHTVLINVLLLKKILVHSIEHRYTFPFGTNKSPYRTLENLLADRFCILSLSNELFSIFQKVSIKSTVRLIEFTEYSIKRTVVKFSWKSLLSVPYIET